MAKSVKFTNCIKAGDSAKEYTPGTKPKKYSTYQCKIKPKKTSTEGATDTPLKNADVVADDSGRVVAWEEENGRIHCGAVTKESKPTDTYFVEIAPKCRKAAGKLEPAALSPYEMKKAQDRLTEKTANAIALLEDVAANRDKYIIKRDYFNGKKQIFLKNGLGDGKHKLLMETATTPTPVGGPSVLRKMSVTTKDGTFYPELPDVAKITRIYVKIIRAEFTTPAKISPRD